jgi:hypothetical protein
MGSDVGLFEDTVSVPEFTSIIDSIGLAGIEKRIG